MIVLLGGSGYIGSVYRHSLQNRKVPFLSLSRKEVNYTDQDTLTKILRDVKADFLINAAGYTGKPNVDACEEHKAECLLANTVFPATVKEACEAAGVPWGHISSGCIYSGRRHDGKGFTEEDSPNFSFRQNNCSFYSGTKALAEEILADASRCYLWRLRIPFDNLDGPHNYLSKLMRYAFLLDVENSISHRQEFVEATLQCWEKRVPFGCYNIVNPGSVTTREIVALIKERGMVKKEFRYFESEAAFMRVAAKTPRSSCVLDSSKLARVGIELSPVLEAIRRALAQWQPSPDPFSL